MHIYFFYLLTYKKCHFIWYCALFVKIREIIYINQCFAEGRNVLTLRPLLRPLHPKFRVLRPFSFYELKTALSRRLATNDKLKLI